MAKTTQNSLENNVLRRPASDVSDQGLMDQVTVVIPTLNEEESIGEVVKEVRAVGYAKILVVDGHSTDKTVDVAEKAGAEVILQHGKGKAGALVTGFGRVTTRYCLVMDGDGTYDPKEASGLIEPLVTHDCVKGERRTFVNMDATHRLGNYLITAMFNMLFGTAIPDVCSGMYSLRTAVASKMNFDLSDRTSVEQEVLAHLVSFGAKVTSVPISYRRRFGGQSKVHTWRQGLRDLYRDFALARTYNPVFLFSLLASLAILPASAFLVYASFDYLVFHAYHGGYFLASLLFFVLGGQGITVATIATLVKRVERRVVGLSAPE